MRRHEHETLAIRSGKDCIQVLDGHAGNCFLFGDGEPYVILRYLAYRASSSSGDAFIACVAKKSWSLSAVSAGSGERYDMSEPPG